MRIIDADYVLSEIGEYAMHPNEELVNNLAIAFDIVVDAPTIDAVSEWIPCSERLPKIGEYHISEPCIVYCKGGVYAFAELEENIFGQVGWNCERDDDYHEPIGEVLAWMPLPKPYEGRESDGDNH